MKVEDILNKPVTEITVIDIQNLVDELNKARSILNDAVNCSSVCNNRDYDMIREKAYQYFVPKSE